MVGSAATYPLHTLLFALLFIIVVGNGFGDKAFPLEPRKHTPDRFFYYPPAMAPLALVGFLLFLSCSSPPASVVIARCRHRHLPFPSPLSFVDCCFERSLLSSSARSCQSHLSSAPPNSCCFWWQSLSAVCLRVVVIVIVPPAMPLPLPQSRVLTASVMQP